MYPTHLCRDVRSGKSPIKATTLPLSTPTFRKCAIVFFKRWIASCFLTLSPSLRGGAWASVWFGKEREPAWQRGERTRWFSSWSSTWRRSAKSVAGYLFRFLVCFGDRVINHVLVRAAAAAAAICCRRRVLPGRPTIRTVPAQPPRQAFLLPPGTRPVWIRWISGTLLPTSTAVLPSSEYNTIVFRSGGYLLICSQFPLIYKVQNL